MKKYARFALVYSLFSLGISLVWAFAHFAYFGYKWVKSYSIPTQTHASYLDIRHDKDTEGKVLRFRAIKANPDKSVYFGHIWVVWQSPPPLSNGAIAAGYYPADKKEAFVKLVTSFLSPLDWINGQKPIKGTMKDDANLKYDWEMVVRLDESAYVRATRIDNEWRNQDSYSLRAGIGKKTKNCRDYAFDIAQAIGLKTDAYNWAEFPPETFIRFLESNRGTFGNNVSLLTVAN